MASAFTHAIVAVTLGKSLASQKMPRRFWIWTVLCSILPDADVVGFIFGIRYDAFFGHRGFFHSLFFALIASWLLVRLVFKKESAAGQTIVSLNFYFFLVMASHACLDALTNGGLGVAFFSPFDARRYFFPWRPLEVSPIGVGSFFSERGREVMANEFE